MRKILTLFISVAIITLTVVGCSKDVEPVHSLENELEEANKQIEQNTKLLDEKGKKIAQLEKKITQREETIGELHAKVNSLEEINEKDFSIIKGEAMSLHNWKREIDLGKTLGEPIAKEVRRLEGDGFTGTFIKVHTYDGIKITLFSPNGDFFWIKEMNIDSEQFQTFRGISIGDSVETLKTTYPNITLAQDGKSVENNGVYQIFSFEKSLNFKVEDGQITSMYLYYEIN